MNSKFTLWVLFLLAANLQLFAQSADDPVASLNKINEQMALLNNKYLIYMSEMAHGRKAKKAEKKHQAYLEQITNFRYALVEIPYYKGDKSLHEGTKKFLKLVESIQKEDYTKIVNLEEIAEQSYDAMEAYVMFKKKIDEKMSEADKEYEAIVEEYCKNHNINLVEGPKTEQESKMGKIGDVTDYYDQVYLIFFKASIHDDQLMEAMGKNNLTAVEQIKGSLLKYSLEGIATLDTLKLFRGGDASLKQTCKRAMEFFKKEAGMIDACTDYMIKKEDFEAIQKNFERNAKAKSDQKEIDKYNAAIKELNKSMDKSNQVIQTLNKSRADVYNDWNAIVKRFMDTHIPYAK